MKRRGLRAPYACARCGLPKAGHICAVITGRAVGSQVDLKVTKGEVEASRIEGAAHVLHVGGGGQLRDTKGKLLENIFPRQLRLVLVHLRRPSRHLALKRVDHLVLGRELSRRRRRLRM